MLDAADAAVSELFSEEQSSSRINNEVFSLVLRD